MCYLLQFVRIDVVNGKNKRFTEIWYKGADYAELLRIQSAKMYSFHTVSSKTVDGTKIITVTENNAN